MRVLAQRVETVCNRRLYFVDKNVFPMSSGASEGASERTNESSGAREQSEQCGASEYVSDASEQVSEEANDPVPLASIL